MKHTMRRDPIDHTNDRAKKKLPQEVRDLYNNLNVVTNKLKDLST